ncbi:MAG: DMT family transporter [Cyanobacteria bacterium J06639_1]
MNPILRGRSFVIASALMLAVQNVFLRVMFSESQLFGGDRVGGLLPATFDHSLLLLWMRSLWMMVLMVPLARWLYPKTFPELRDLKSKPRLLLSVLGSGVTLFGTLVCLYTAVANLSAGVAIAIFFLYPAFTPVLTRWIFGERFTRLRAGAAAIATAGIALASPGFAGAGSGNIGVGVGAALGAAVIFSVHGILAQVSLKSLHPVPFTLSTFLTIAILGGLAMPALTFDVASSAWLPLWICSAVMAVLATVSYLLSNFGIRDIGVTPAFLIGASSPMFTAIAAAVAIDESLLTRQWFGIACITLAILALGLEKLPPQRSNSKKPGV